MTEQSLLKFTDELLESSCLYCAICKNILKPPIMLVETIGNVCTICYNKENQLVTNLKSMNNSALENVLSLLKLPCKFKLKGCIERFSYEELAFHQNTCKFHTKVCPMFKLSGCEWEGNSLDLVDHFKECHGHHIINFENDLFFLQTSLNEINMVKLLVMKQHTYILRMKNDLQKNKIFYMICSVSDDYSSFCEYAVKHKGSSDNYIKTKSKILSSFFIYDEFDENVAVTIDVNALKQISQVSDTITNIFKIKLAESPIDISNENISYFFECPVCKNIMKPPIYQCHSGHSICSLCRPRLETCPTCRSTFGNTRNYSLEGLTAGITYPCIYQDSGCTEIGSATDMVKHERECTFKPYNCPFPSCTSSGNHDNLVNHLINFHFDSVICNGTSGFTEAFRLDQGNLFNKIFDRKCIIAYNHIFKITCKKVSDHCLMAAEVVGCQNNSKTFVYEVAVIDMRRPEKKLIRTDYCLSRAISEEEVFKKCIMFPNSVLSCYSNHGMVTFNFTIKEK